MKKSKIDPKIEIRVPTFRRPALLRRALESLISQTYENWSCRVFDDCPNHSAKEVCESLGDKRISYCPADKNLGISRNIDRSFSIDPHADSTFLCVLEDDNFYFPEHFAKSVLIFEKENIDIVLGNQLIEEMVSRDAPGYLKDETVFDGSYSEGVLSHDSLFSTFFYSCGATNSSLFWRAGVGLDFSTIKYLDDPVSQERLRTLCIDRDVYVSLEPTVVWRNNGEESLRPKLATSLSWRIAQIKFASDERAIYQNLFRYLGKKGIEDQIYRPLVGPLNASRQRVLRRVGVPIPMKYNTLSPAQRFPIFIKLCLAKLGAFALQYQPVIKLDAISNRLSIRYGASSLDSV
jgi:glycosyltransferase involved in cell wall biosynthesis